MFKISPPNPIDIQRLTNRQTDDALKLTGQLKRSHRVNKVQKLHILEASNNSKFSKDNMGTISQPVYTPCKRYDFWGLSWCNGA